MIKFTTTTAEVRHQYVRQNYMSRFPSQRDWKQEEIDGAEFDQWLAAHDAEKDAEIERLRGIIAETAKWRHDWFEPTESATYPHKTRLHVRKLDAILDKADETLG